MIMAKQAVIKPDEMTERQEVIAEMRLNGFTQEAIARQLEISQQTVSKELKKIRNIWRDRCALSYDEHVSQAVARYDQLAEALAPRIAMGQAVAIDTAIRLEDRRARLLGIDKPVEQKVTISIEAIDNRIAELEAKAADAVEGSAELELDYIEGEVVEDVEALD